MYAENDESYTEYDYDCNCYGSRAHAFRCSCGFNKLIDTVNYWYDEAMRLTGIEDPWAAIHAL